MKNLYYLRNSEDRVNSAKIVFPPYLNSCIKCKSMFISETVRDRVILMKVLAPGVYSDSSAILCQKIAFLPLFEAILNFGVKFNAFNLETV